MTRSLEQLIKMHDPRSVSIETLNVGRGRGILSRAQILGAFAATEHENKIGYDILLTKYRDCDHARNRLEAIIEKYILGLTQLPYATKSGVMSLNLILELPLPSQIMHNASNLKRYSPKFAHLRRNITELSEQIRNKKKCEEECSQLEKQLYLERDNLNKLAIIAANKTCICQRCRGTAVISKQSSYQQCTECNGSGRIIPTIDHIKKSLAILGAEISIKEWDAQYVPVIKKCLNWLYAAESDAVQFLSNRLRNEVLDTCLETS